MAILKKYIKTVHDIHLYSPDAQYDPRVQGNQIGFNGDCQGAHLNWTGVSLRPRAFCRTTNSTVGFTEPYQASNINFWNTCNPCAVLISPKHAIICQHYRGKHPREDEYYSFMGISGLTHSRKVVGVTLNIGNDHTLLEFESEFPADVAFYDKIADVKYVGSGTTLWVHDCNGKAYKLNFVRAQLDSAGNTVSFNYTPRLDGINDGISTNGWLTVFGGDSGSPTFVTDQYGKTVLVGLMHGGMQINEMEILSINTAMAASGYSVKHVKLTAKSEDFNQDGKVDAEDLAVVMENWGVASSLIADLNGDGKIDAQDLSKLLASWGMYQIETNYQAPAITPTGSSETRR